MCNHLFGHPGPRHFNPYQYKPAGTSSEHGIILFWWRYNVPSCEKYTLLIETLGSLRLTIVYGPCHGHDKFLCGLISSSGILTVSKSPRWYSLALVLYVCHTESYISSVPAGFLQRQNIMLLSGTTSVVPDNP